MLFNRGDRANRLAATVVVAVGGGAIVATTVQAQTVPSAPPTMAQPQPPPTVLAQNPPALAPAQAGQQPPTQKNGDWPRLLKQGQDKPQQQSMWTEVEIQVAQARCLDILKGLDIVAVGAPPIRENEECGAPAPIELISVGKNPEVTLSPTVTVTCDMAATLHQWVTRDLQPLAIRFMGAPIIRLDTMSSYSCRNAYGRTKSRLSEHGRANAIDIRSFTTARASTADLLADWGPTQRDIQAKIAAAKAEAARIEAVKAAEAAAKAATGKGATPSGAPPAAQGANPIASGPSSSNAPSAALSGAGAPSPSGPIPGLSVEPQTRGGIGIGITLPAPSRLGGPKGPATIAAENSIMTDTPAARMMFLKKAHETACRIFGTVLGPEANNAHRNHFHVDMAPRARGNFCE